MARITRRLKPLELKRLTKPGLHSDGNGLYLCVSKSGAKSWRIIYIRKGNRRELGIGSLSGVSLADARTKADEACQLLAKGLDPKQVWREIESPRPPITFGAVALSLIESREGGWKNAKHRQQWRNTLETYAAPIWSKAVANVDVEDILQILQPIWMEKQETASRVRGRIEAVLNAAKVRNLRSGDNPAVWRGHLDLLLSKRRNGPKRHHPAMPFAEVPGFMKRLRDRPALAARALELTILTAARTSEVLQARWAEVELDAALWIIPAERMKTGKEHRVPLPARAVELLRGLKTEDDHVFPGQATDKPLSNMAMEMCLRRMGADNITVHGFRSSFRDWCGEMTDYPRELAEQALAHVVGSEVERAYRRGDALEKRRELMETWSKFLSD